MLLRLGNQKHFFSNHVQQTMPMFELFLVSGELGGWWVFSVDIFFNGSPIVVTHSELSVLRLDGGLAICL